MKKRMLSMVVTVALLLGCGAMQVFAADAKVTASLPADKQSVSSGYVEFETSNMYGQVYDISKYPIKYQTLGRNGTSGEGTQEEGFVCAVGASYSKTVRNQYNYHCIKLTCWNVNSAAKGSIGYGYVE